MDGGALLRPSSASKWIACPPSARFEQFQNEEGETIYTEEGTLAHRLAECLIEGSTDLVLRRQVYDFYSRNPELEGSYETMHGYALEFANFVKDIGGQILTETKLKYNDVVFGTGDAINIVDRILYVSDLKFGAGKKVKAQDNPQLLLYGLMALEAFGDDFDRLVLTIYQPRLGGLSSMDITPLELREWETFEVIPAIQLALAGKGEFKTGEHCVFCKAKANCLALFKDYKDVSALQFKGLTPADIVEILDKGAGVKKFIDEVNKDALRRALAGETFEGYSVGKSNGKRYITDPEAVEGILFDNGFEFDEIYKATLVPLTQLEAKLKKAEFTKLLGAYIDKTQGAPKLVKGETADPYNPADVFDDND